MKEIIDAVEILKGYMENDSLFTDHEKNALPVLLDLAEKVLAVEGKMPEKKDVSQRNVMNLVYHPPAKDGDTLTTQVVNYDYREGWNDAIDQCTLAITKALLSEEELTEILIKNIDYTDDHSQDRKIAKAILKAQQDKQEGK